MSSSYTNVEQFDNGGVSLAIVLNTGWDSLKLRMFAKLGPDFYDVGIRKQNEQTTTR